MTRHVYGPVPSRRLGRSLGVDLVPFKTCSYDCLYCQLGPTTCKTSECREWIETNLILEQVGGALPSRPDVITLAGSGEPTLHAGLGTLIGGIKAMTDIPVAVLSNGSLFWREEVLERVMEADILMPSLDAGDADTFKRINRPHAEITFEKMVRGLEEMNRTYRGEIRLEILLMEGVNASDEDVEKMVRLVGAIRPHRVELNTTFRPSPGYEDATVAPGRLRELATRFPVPTEVIARNAAPEASGDGSVTDRDLLVLLRRRPCTVEDIAEGLGIHRGEALKSVEALANAGRCLRVRQGKKLFYRAN